MRNFYLSQVKGGKEGVLGMGETVGGYGEGNLFFGKLVKKFSKMRYFSHSVKLQTQLLICFYSYRSFL